MRGTSLLGMLRRTAPLLAALAVTLRVLVPAGVMFEVAPDGGLQMTLCTGQGAMALQPGDPDSGPEPAEASPDSPCAFAGLAVFSPADSALLPGPAPWPTPSAPRGAQANDLRPGLGLPAPPPPKTGPPRLA
jgi:hypothetical protein